MSEVTLEAISLLLANELQPVRSDLAEIKDTLAAQTTALSELATDVKTLLDEKTVTAARLDRLEHWATQVSEKLGIKLEL